MATIAPEPLSVSSMEKPPSLHDSARGSPEPLDAFHTLVKDINTILGPCNGIDSAGIDVEELKKLMAEYVSQPQEWERYAFAGRSTLFSSSYLIRK